MDRISDGSGVEFTRIEKVGNRDIDHLPGTKIRLPRISWANSNLLLYVVSKRTLWKESIRIYDARGPSSGRSPTQMSILSPEIAPP
jgi:hypothetical protein